MKNDLGASEARWDETEADAAQAAAYVAELAGDLASIARRHGLDALGYILEMAKLEAETVTRHVNGRR
jgi:hypothetical protein